MSKKIKNGEWKIILLYVSFIALFGPFGEILIGHLYTSLFGFPLWQYHILPVNSSYTSLIAPLVWSIAGLATYFIHEHLTRGLRVPPLISLPFAASLIAIETIIIEFIINVSFWLLTSQYIFFYTPGELLHFTSIQTLPFYFLSGIALIISMKRFKKDPLFFTVLSLCFMFVLLFLSK